MLPSPPLQADRCRFFILGWGQDKEDKEGKKTRGKNRTEFGSVKLTSKSRNALFFVLTLPCLRSPAVSTIEQGMGELFGDRGSLKLLWVMGLRYYLEW